MSDEKGNKIPPWLRYVISPFWRQYQLDKNAKYRSEAAKEGQRKRRHKKNK